MDVVNFVTGVFQDGYRVFQGVSADKVVEEKSDVQKDQYEHVREEVIYSGYDKNGTLIAEKGVETKEASETGTERILPERYYKKILGGYLYYQGERISRLELLEKAVSTGQMELDETQTIAYNYLNAEKAMLFAKAKPLFEWSTSLYSEDGMYKYRVEGGVITGAMRAYYEENGKKIFMQDIAKQLASGIAPKDVDGDVSWLMWNDPELYRAAVDIGVAKRGYYQSTQLYKQGHLTSGQYLHDLYPMFLLLFGKYADVHDKSMQKSLKDFFEADGFAERALRKFNPEYNKLVDDLVLEKIYHAYSGIY
ncbi:MAG: hypothetical protein IJ733_01095 [Lachnospiraceae bacterium]|nr:hypothetical protein [Lachnospiraceae bacterium]